MPGGPFVFLDLHILNYLDKIIHLMHHDANCVSRHIMLSLSQTTGYAILALSCLRQSSGSLVLAKDVAQCTGITLPYLLKLLHAMGKAGLVVAKRGYRGGFALARPAEEISLLDVAEAVEGKAWLPNCLLGLDNCSGERQCPAHEFWEAERQRIRTKLRQISVRDVADHESKQAKRRLGQCSSQVAHFVAADTASGRRPNRGSIRHSRAD